jgi:hypothetical protein
LALFNQTSVFSLFGAGMSDPSKNSEPATEGALTELEREERRRFSRLSTLHESLTQSRTADGLRLLEIARRRWLESRNALRQVRAGD